MLMQALQKNEIERELVIKSAVREAADFFAMYMKKRSGGSFLSGFYPESKVHCNCSELCRFVFGRCL